MPELAKRTCSRSKRRHSSSASATTTAVGAAKCVPRRGRATDGLDDPRMGVAGHADAEAAVEVGVLVGVDVPHLRALAAVDVDRIRIAGLERRGHAERHAGEGTLVERLRRDGPGGEGRRLGVGDLRGPHAQAVAGARGVGLGQQAGGRKKALVNAVSRGVFVHALIAYTIAAGRRI